MYCDTNPSSVQNFQGLKYTSESLVLHVLPCIYLILIPINTMHMYYTYLYCPQIHTMVLLPLCGCLQQQVLPGDMVLVVIMSLMASILDIALIITNTQWYKVRAFLNFPFTITALLLLRTYISVCNFCNIITGYGELSGTFLNSQRKSGTSLHFFRLPTCTFM